ncbi:MAG: electron transfer flavoprotein subunit alpha/FixB family protein [Dethiobacteria bacterium]
MKKIFVFSEKKDLAAGLLTAAAGLGVEAAAFAFDEKMAQALLEYGPAKVYVIDGTDRPESYARAMADYLLEHGADLFLVGSTPVGRELAASVAAYADAAMISDAHNITLVEGSFIVELTIYSGLVCRQEKLRGFGVVTAGRGLAAAEAAGAKGSVERISLEPDKRVTVIKEEPVEKTGVDLSAACRVVGIGMGAQEADVETAREIAGLMGAELACSRGVAEQRHWLPLERYVGISGAVISPDLYFTLAISGQIQHIYGCRDSKIIVAINKDETAPIFRAADYGIVGDIHEYMPLLIEALKAMQADN